MKVYCLIAGLLFSQLSFAGAGVTKIKKNRVYVVSIGFGGDNWKPDSSLKQVGYNNCPTCKSDAKFFAEYFTKMNLRKSNIDSVINFTFTSGIQLEELFDVFNQVQKKIQPDDVFVFYYSSGSWGFNNNAFSGKEESYYVLNNRLVNKQGINKHAFTLQTLKQLTDRLPANNQLIIFDTGLGPVIQKDFYSNFFNANPVEAAFTKKNRMIICPEQMSGETFDNRDKIKKGDLVRIISSLPDSLHILNLFENSGRNNNVVYKQMMKHFWQEQDCCMATLKILKETEYLDMLTTLQPNLAQSKRSTILSAKVQEVDSNLVNRKKKAIIISTDNYMASGLWKNLYTPAKDGKAIAELLKSKFGYDTTLLINPTKNEILKAIDNIVYKDVANPYNQYIIYFAGHGFWEGRRKTGFIVTANSVQFSDPTLPESAELATYLEYEQLFNNLRQLNKVILITDVCFGGTSFNSLVQNNTIVNPKNEKTRLLNPYKKILASGISEVDDFIKLHDGSISQNSPFAMGVLAILQQSKNNISFERLYADLKDKMKDEKLSSTPVTKDFGAITEPNEFIF